MINCVLIIVLVPQNNYFSCRTKLEEIRYGGFGEDLPGAENIFPGAPGAEVLKYTPGVSGFLWPRALGALVVLKNIFFRKNPIVG